MKFLCEQCKAKYQIDDSKVAGKTVRMKCRKCGHLIEVRAAVTETSVASGLPRVDETRVGAPDPAGLQKAGDKSTSTPAPPRPGAPQKPQPPKTSTGLATSLASAKPQTRAPAAPVQEKGSALAGAFSKSVQKDDEALLELSTTAEWYVAINGVPVGPIRLSELRRKAASGAITEDSLCWQEGLEEWRPLKTVTELAAIVREAAASARPSLANPPSEIASSLTPHSSGTASRPPGRTSTPAPSPARGEPAKAAPMAARSNVVSLSSRLATAEKLDPLHEPDEQNVISDPFAAIAPEPAPPVADSSAAALPLVASASSASSPIATSMSAGVTPMLAGDVGQVAAPKKGPNWIAVAMVVLAAAFGITAAIAIFFRSNQNPTPQVTTVFVSATATTPTASATGVATVDPTATATTTGSAIAAVGTARPTGNGGTAPTATATSTGNSAIASLLGGPQTGPVSTGGSGGTGASGGGLSDKAVQDAVRNYTPGVKRTCWERGGSAESTANIDVTVTVAPNGNVSNAVATGNDPLVAKCIQSQVLNWRFAAPGETTTIKIPFKFLKQ